MDDASADAGVVSLMLCALDDQGVALRELYRVIKPGGQLRFLEHVAADGTLLRLLQRIADNRPTESHRWLSYRASSTRRNRAGGLRRRKSPTPPVPGVQIARAGGAPRARHRGTTLMRHIAVVSCGSRLCPNRSISSRLLG